MKYTLIIYLIALSQATPTKEKIAKEQKAQNEASGTLPSAPNNPIKPAVAWRGDWERWWGGYGHGYGHGYHHHHGHGWGGGWYGDRRW